MFKKWEYKIVNISCEEIVTQILQIYFRVWKRLQFCFCVDFSNVFVDIFGVKMFILNKTVFKAYKTKNIFFIFKILSELYIPLDSLTVFISLIGSFVFWTDQGSVMI